MTPGPDIVLVTNSVPMAETRKETSNADTSSVAPILPKPVLKLKPSKTKPKIGTPVRCREQSCTYKDIAANADLLLGKLVDEIRVDTKPLGMHL